MNRKEETPTENHSTPVVSGIYTKKSIHAEESSLFMNFVESQKRRQKPQV
jgi:hypothetical protein